MNAREEAVKIVPAGTCGWWSGVGKWNTPDEVREQIERAVEKAYEDGRTEGLAREAALGALIEELEDAYRMNQDHRINHAIDALVSAKDSATPGTLQILAVLKAASAFEYVTQDSPDVTYVKNPSGITEKIRSFLKTGAELRSAVRAARAAGVVK